MKIKLDSIEKVQEFSRRVSKLEEAVDLECDRQVIDAKSLLGIYSLDLSKPIRVQTYSEKDAMSVRYALFDFMI